MGLKKSIFFGAGTIAKTSEKSKKLIEKRTVTVKREKA